MIQTETRLDTATYINPFGGVFGDGKRKKKKKKKIYEATPESSNHE